MGTMLGTAHKRGVVVGVTCDTSFSWAGPFV